MILFDGEYQVFKSCMAHFAIALTVSDILTFQIVNLRSKIRVKENGIRNEAVRWRISTSIKAIRLIFALVKFHIFYLEQLGEELNVRSGVIRL